ncbi:MAG: adenine deaminase [Clostridia bacterium]|nr:MAG: adenine deaminase [Clostridia bacterium]
MSDRKALLQVALGQRPADIYISGGRLVNVWTAEVLTGVGVAVAGDRIAYVGPDTGMIGQETTVIDATGSYLVPGYIDAHAHVDTFLSPAAIQAALLPLGTTTLLSYTDDICSAVGPLGLEYMLTATEGMGLGFYFALPPACPSFPGVEGPDLFPVELVTRWAGHPRIRSLGEIPPWGRILAGDREMLAKMQAMTGAGKRVDGHTTGARYGQLNALAASGVSSCHEALRASEVLERIRLGLYVMLRHGSVRQDLPDLAPALLANPGLDTSAVMLTPDFMSPDDIADRGYLNYPLEEAVRLGIPPLAALRMVTVNAARYLRLEEEVGVIAPGRRADILLLPSLTEFRPWLVIVGGQIVARDGEMLLPQPEAGMAPGFSLVPLWQGGWTSIPEDYFVPRVAGVNNGPASVPAIHLRSKTITTSRTVEVLMRDGLIRAGCEGYLILAAPTAPERYPVTCFLSGFGGQVGGVAASYGVGSGKLLVLGASPQDMRQAFLRLVEMGGGMVIVHDGEVRAEFVLPIGGIQAAVGLSDLAASFQQAKRVLAELGCRLQDPIFSIHFLSLTAMPFIRITPYGVFDIRKQSIIYP